MKIKYLVDGIFVISPTALEVVAMGIVNYFVKENGSNVLKAIPEEAIVVKIHKNCRDNPPSIVEYIMNNSVDGLDYSLADKYNIEH